MAGARSLVTQGEIVTVLDNQVSTVSGFTLEWSESGDLRTTAGGSEGDESIDLRYVNGTGYLKSTAFRRFAQRDTWNVLASDDVTVEVMAGFRPESLIPKICLLYATVSAQGSDLGLTGGSAVGSFQVLSSLPLDPDAAGPDCAPNLDSQVSMWIEPGTYRPLLMAVAVLTGIGDQTTTTSTFMYDEPVIIQAPDVEGLP